MLMRTLCAAVLAGLLALPAAGQAPAALIAPRSDGATVTLNIYRLVAEVQMVISVEDNHGRPVLNLGAQQISVFDNGAAVPLTSFQPASGLPLQIALLLDASDSMRPGFAQEQQAAISFLQRAQLSGAQVLSLAFAARPTREPASSPAGTLAAVHLGGQTALYDALIAASDQMRAAPPGRRMLLLLSDGEDNYSRSTLLQAIAALHRGNIAVYAVSVHSPSLDFPGDRVLQQIAAATGGRAFLLPSYANACQIFSRIETQMCGQYVLGFRPVGSPVQGEFHSVELVALRHGTVIHARPGYFITPADELPATRLPGMPAPAD